MKRSLRVLLLASACAFGNLAVTSAAFPAAAQDVSIGFDSFHEALAPYGDWVYSDRWGEVWQPGDVSDDFHPYYTSGRWVDTQDYGWTWASDYQWGDIPFHYGRWVNDPDDGWLWIPGYVWSPGWVVWRSNNRYTGWMPMPPDNRFLRGDEGGSARISFDFGGGDNYGYSRWYGRSYDQNRFAMNWTFVTTGALADRDYRAHAVDQRQVVVVIRSTRNITNYAVVNDHVVNRSVTTAAVVKAGGHPAAPVRAATIFKRPDLITTTTAGSAEQVHMRQTRPRGTGLANSAPQPSAAVVQSLSPHVAAHDGKPAPHLFTRDTVVHAPLKPAPAATGAMPAASPDTAHPIQGPATGLPAKIGRGAPARHDTPPAGTTPSMTGTPMTPATGTETAPKTHRGPATQTTQPPASTTPSMTGTPMTPATGTETAPKTHRGPATQTTQPPASATPSMTGTPMTPATGTEATHKTHRGPQTETTQPPASATPPMHAQTPAAPAMPAPVQPPPPPPHHDAPAMAPAPVVHPVVTEPTKPAIETPPSDLHRHEHDTTGATPPPAVHKAPAGDATTPAPDDHPKKKKTDDQPQQ